MNQATQTVVGYAIVDTACGGTHVGEPYSRAELADAVETLRRLNILGLTDRYTIRAIYA
jgi:hypothetical protein